MTTLEHPGEIGAPNGTQALIDVATRASLPQPLGHIEGRLYSVVTPSGEVKVIDVEDHLDSYRDRPRRKTGKPVVHDADSFVAYLAKHAMPETEVWADVDNVRVVGVVNAHTPGAAGFADHRVTYQVKHTPAWLAWTGQDGKLLDQSAFAEFIEERVDDIATPTGADMLELAQSFHASTAVNFESTKVLNSGERQFEYREETSASAGRSGQLSIPKELSLFLEPFEGTDATYPVTAKFRYRLSNGKLLLGYHLENPQDVIRAAFNDVLGTIADGIAGPIFKGVSTS